VVLREVLPDPHTAVLLLWVANLHMANEDLLHLDFMVDPVDPVDPVALPHLQMVTDLLQVTTAVPYHLHRKDTNPAIRL
jgi:hypothetical protein